MKGESANGPPRHKATTKVFDVQREQTTRWHR